MNIPLIIMIAGKARFKQHSRFQ